MLYGASRANTRTHTLVRLPRVMGESKHASLAECLPQLNLRAMQFVGLVKRCCPDRASLGPDFLGPRIFAKSEHDESKSHFARESPGSIGEWPDCLIAACGLERETCCV